MIKIKTGKKHSEETKKKMSEAHKGKVSGAKGKHWKHSEETKRKMSKSGKGKNLGVPKSKEHKKKLSEANRGDRGSNWQGGIAYNPYPYDWTETLKESIRQRDYYVCQECGIHQEEIDNGRIKKLDIHHIDYNKDNCNIENLITLCRSCHIKTNFNRDYWIEHFDFLSKL